MDTNLLALLIMCVVAALIPGLFIVLTSVLGPKKPSAEKSMPFECGVSSTGSRFKRFPVKFYVVAMMFLVFDLESVALYLWAVMFRELRFMGFFTMFLFVGILIVGLVYAWGEGGLEWE